MKISEKILERQLGYLYQLVQIQARNRITIKGWCITVWLAIVVVALTRKDAFLELKAQVIFFGPIVLFWFLEAVEQAVHVLRQKQLVEIEKRLAERKFEISEASECFIRSRYLKFGLREKFCAFVAAPFTKETTTSFYAILLFASLLLVWLVF